MNCEQEASLLIRTRPELALEIAGQMRKFGSALSLTRCQKEALEFIREYCAEHGGVAPSYDEIMSGLGIHSKSGVHRLVTALEQRGHIDRIPGIARSIVVTGASA